VVRIDAGGSTYSPTRIADRAPWYAVRWRHRNPEPAARRVPHHRASIVSEHAEPAAIAALSAMVAVGSILVMGVTGTKRRDGGQVPVALKMAEQHADEAIATGAQNAGLDVVMDAFPKIE
jgi:hypothetical protein